MKVYLIVLLCVIEILPQAIFSQSLSKEESLKYSFKKPSNDGTGKIYYGREIAAMQGFEGAEWLERKNRQEEENSLEAMRHFPIQPNSMVADIGAGTGYYTFKIAALVPKGKVYAVEVQKEYIDYLNHSINKQKITNVLAIRSTAMSPNLPLGTMDLVFMVDVYHELEFPHEMLQALKKSLKPGGHLLLMEYKKEDPLVPIKELHKMSLKQVDLELTANGFIKEKIEEFLPWQHLIIYKKPIP